MFLDYDSIAEGDAIPSLKKKPITQVQLARYAGAAGDFNPIHLVPSYAKEAGLEGTIAHGMLVMGMLAQMISNWVGVKPVTKYGVSFRAMTKPGNVLTATGEVTKKYAVENEKFLDLNVRIADEKGEVKVDGRATLRF